MSINIQITSLLFSLLFGALFSLFLRINYKYIYKGPIVLKILINIMFVTDNILLYFIILKRINNGIVHTYFLLMILLGFVIAEYLYKRLSIAFKHQK